MDLFFGQLLDDLYGRVFKENIPFAIVAEAVCKNFVSFPIGITRCILYAETEKHHLDNQAMQAYAQQQDGKKSSMTLASSFLTASTKDDYDDSLKQVIREIVVVSCQTLEAASCDTNIKVLICKATTTTDQNDNDNSKIGILVHKRQERFISENEWFFGSSDVSKNENNVSLRRIRCLKPILIPSFNCSKSSFGNYRLAFGMQRIAIVLKEPSSSDWHNLLVNYVVATPNHHQVNDDDDDDAVESNGFNFEGETYNFDDLLDHDDHYDNYDQNDSSLKTLVPDLHIDRTKSNYSNSTKFSPNYNVNNNSMGILLRSETKMHDGNVHCSDWFGNPWLWRSNSLSDSWTAWFKTGDWIAIYRPIMDEQAREICMSEDSILLIIPGKTFLSTHPPPQEILATLGLKSPVNLGSSLSSPTSSPRSLLQVCPSTWRTPGKNTQQCIQQAPMYQSFVHFSDIKGETDSVCMMGHLINIQGNKPALEVGNNQRNVLKLIDSRGRYFFVTVWGDAYGILEDGLRGVQAGDLLAFTNLGITMVEEVKYLNAHRQWNTRIWNLSMMVGLLNSLDFMPIPYVVSGGGSGGSDGKMLHDGLPWSTVPATIKVVSIERLTPVQIHGKCQSICNKMAIGVGDGFGDGVRVGDGVGVGNTCYTGSYQCPFCSAVQEDHDVFVANNNDRKSPSLGKSSFPHIPSAELERGFLATLRISLCTTSFRGFEKSDLIAVLRPSVMQQFVPALASEDAMHDALEAALVGNSFKCILNISGSNHKHNIACLTPSSSINKIIHT